MSRKTVDVADILETANAFLAASSASSTMSTLDEQRALRTGIIAMLENTLFRTGNYKGFQYLESEFLPAAEQTADNVLRTDHDNTRRRYY